ncbi:MAG: tRNA threonylcarbamoyladenosine dehydratase [Schaedlerella sp.]|uniref:tRNA threonylcarbamoyladenosine dehydratase n=1 Tax=Schaedlerella sp. TaxID=2676057 RepID=UPI002622CBC9|nr:tRNA threonylcarbamoyladenosine dehydratase [uncultured Schaedlerella sp.]
MIHEFSRTELLIGPEAMERLKKAEVAVFGVGGVGSHCIDALARSGVGSLILIDNDKVSLTNINRQCVAYHHTVGRYKTKVMEEQIRAVCPKIRVQTYERFILKEDLSELFETKPDYIVDAVDTVTAKLTIAEWAQREGIPLISSMGTGNKLHPELFEIADLSETSVCPLCKVMRREMKARGIPHLKVLYSREQPADVSGRMPEEAQEGRRAVPGSISFVPPAAGLLIAGEVIRTLAGIDT